MENYEIKLDLNEYFIKHPAATFFVKVVGNSMEGEGIKGGDMLIVDRSKRPKSGSIVVAVVDGEFTVKKLTQTRQGLFLTPANPKFKPVKITKSMEFEVWGVVTGAIHSYL